MGWKDRAMPEHARGTFAVTLTPEESGLPQVGWFRLEKIYAGDAVGAGITGRPDLEILDGQHHYDLVYELPDG
jgi:hypothetical protein